MSSEPEREQALVFGEVADQYDEMRPSYPDALFDTVIEFGGLRADDAALGDSLGEHWQPDVFAGGLDVIYDVRLYLATRKG